MKWHTVNEYPFALSPDDEEVQLKKDVYQYFINHMGFDRWAYYTPVKNLSKLLHGDRGYNAGHTPPSHGVSYYPWLDHATYFRDTLSGRTVLVTQPYPHNQSLVTTEGLDMTDTEAIELYTRAFSFYRPGETEIYMIVSKEVATYYRVMTSAMLRELVHRTSSVINKRLEENEQ